PEDCWLSQWIPLDHLLVLECLSTRSPFLRRFSQSLSDQLDSWMEGHPKDIPVIYREWIRGEKGKSRADQLLGSLGFVLDSETARKTALLATFRAIILKERGEGVSSIDLERRWSVANLSGVEEQWRDYQLWLISGCRALFETPCFYYCLRESCEANDIRI